MYLKSVMNNTKLSNYLVDGTGRDTYVSNFNGGFWKSNQMQAVRPESGSYPNRRYQASPAPCIDSKINRYRNNGSGRDGYISYDEGGFSVSIGMKKNFISNLRGYDTKIRCNTRDSSTMLQSFSKTQSITKRLYYSKQVEDPYLQIRKLTSLHYKK
ncbi:unnamed protein product (macronuclear) [Paramecium tetraurelia]|uniref:Uncharacterized protein n=1 Tax=Paramecium tetraurelia TaxID=5888 RepID=A0BFC6_PARTE|nr:uncharacterized protein GSPATT00028278001 [Paramecium tetraurelia]CAK57243.1 unnamed protein product [Paramecium tetraurelia]|eukprot:XP_001424641.1 hypothetical protein (macronuclear) [Paramecium tetraurelia strain d4-2]